MHVLAGEGGGQRGGAVAGVHDDQRGASPAVAGCLQAAQQVLDLPRGLAGAGGLGGALHIGQRGPGGAQVPERRDELVLPAGDGLAGAVAAAGVMMNVPAFWRALGVRARIRRGIDREPQPPPPRARLPHGGRLPGGQPRQRLVQQPAVDLVVPAHPGMAFLAVDELRQRAGQQPGERLLIDLACGQRVIQRAVPAAEGRYQRQLHQRGHRVIGAQDRVAQLEQRISAGGQAPVQPGAELPQRHVPGDGVGDLGRVRGGRDRRRQRELLPAGSSCENMVIQRPLP